MQIITGFDPFDGAAVNPSEHVASAVAARTEGMFLRLPTRYSAAFTTLERAVESSAEGGSPVTSIVLLGRAAKEPGLRVERLGRIGITSTTRDNDGVMLSGPIVEDGPVTLTSIVDIDGAMDAARTASPQLTVHVSEDAGGFVCNYLYYRTLHAYPGIPTVFVHLDGADELLGGEPPADSASLDDLIKGVAGLARYVGSTVDSAVHVR